ncbi:hypothetical protein RG959_19665 [Domibacillus sp. 8LH]|uniref:hypothetical protein n=1 Tax=Domibacillus sp. 8LH TaxID=3073900 RepID=UPI00316AF8D2
MPWGVKTLKIIGNGLVQESDLTSFEFPLGHYEDYIVLDEKHREIIKIATFPTFLFEEKFYGKENGASTLIWTEKLRSRTLDLKQMRSSNYDKARTPHIHARV